MHARVSTYSGPPDRLDAGIRNFEGLTDALRGLEGFEGAYLLADAETGKAITITLWSSDDTAAASAERARQMRTEAAEGAGLSVESVATYEVAVQIQPGG
jgi:heme-degrading monooxygenase HmoA